MGLPSVETKRLFIAVPLSSEAKALAGSISKELSKTGADVAWVNAEQIHITLKFLGATDTKKIGLISDELNKIAASQESFSISLGSLGGFPTLHNPKVIWIGLIDPRERLRILAEEIDQAVSRLGFEKESRPYQAHLTLGRVRTARNRLALIEKMEKMPPAEELLVPVERMVLFESKLSPKGATHLSLKEFPLEYLDYSR